MPQLPSTFRASAAMPAILHTGPLVAFFARAECHHRWVIERLEGLETPLLVCEPVLTEAAHLLGRRTKGQDALFELLHNGALKIAFRIEEHFGALRKLLQKYRRTPMSLADACLVLMTESPARHDVL